MEGGHVYCGAVEGCPIQRPLCSPTPPGVRRRHRPESLKRQVTDSRGNRWDVWEVDPKDLDRVAYDRRSTGRNQDAPRAGPIAPWTPVDVATLHPELRDGWLCFQLDTERRRFAPIPPHWLELPENVLRVMLDVATPVTRSPNRPVDSGETTTPNKATE
jgi:hypothetical protein